MSIAPFVTPPRMVARLSSCVNHLIPSHQCLPPSQPSPSCRTVCIQLTPVYNTGARKGEVCVSILHAPGEDQWGYEDAGERWLPVHTVETVLISVISLLSADVPDLNSPANVDAAKEVREDYPAYKKRVKRLARRSAEEAYD